MRTLRGRLILSHTLPLFIMLLLSGIALDYVLETKILLPIFTDELIREAELLAETSISQREVWDNPTAAQEYLDRLRPHLDAHVMLLDIHGQLLASTDPLILQQVGTVIEPRDYLVPILAGDVNVHTENSRHFDANVADVFVPATGKDDEVIGIIRMTYHLEDIYDQFLALRYVIFGILLTAIILGTIVALVLALSIRGELKQATQAVLQLASGKEVETFPERGAAEMRTLQRAVISLVERLRGMEEARGKLLSNLVHELGRPLGALLTAVQALQGGAGDDEELRQEILSGMKEEVGFLDRLLNDLTRLQDQVFGALELRTRPVELAQWLPQVLRSHREVAIEKGLKWKVNVPPDLPVVDADPDRLAQALGNLVHNAIKFTPPDGTVIVDAGVINSEVWIQVKDTGPGIPLKEQPKIFTPFYRSHSTTRVPQGKGLGLSIARDLILAHQGRLEFTSSEGEGSCFTIWLPFQPRMS
jgi:signal transduction histidine kinase